MPHQLIREIQQGNIKSLSRVITMIENGLDGCDEIVKNLPFTEKKVIGITGPPGAGKSTLTDGLIYECTNNQKKVGVLCVDPSSPFTKGALLGDRIRMNGWFNHPGVFIRSLANRGSTGGLHPNIIEITEVMKAAPFDYIIIETVGTGQTETEIAGLADTTIVVLVPEAGDEIQNMKSGLMEIADIFVLNKADRPEANKFEKNLLAMIQLSFRAKQKKTPVIKTIATEKKGVAELMEKILVHQANGGNDEAKYVLLAKKAYWLIREKRMKDISLDFIAGRIASLSEKKEFNLYKFVEEF